MANKDRNKRAARKARQAKRQQAEATQAAQAAAIASDPQAAKAQEKALKKAEAKKQPAKKQEPGKKPGLVQRTKTYFGDVRSEMRRVVWPTRTELKNFTVAVVVLLVVFGVAVWLIDTGVVAALVGYSGLRG
ncbi:preprotein translocase subunit SecE [Olsenella sp. YH-ols2217]|uniref:Protein translocase subunit SecE n=1 Tax=Kribbibacterium absianum TaxID=3044210 RepID=A0ABT6ZKQ8_9ACTN|nr:MULTISPECIES: preprotein translocase subunit SecE [unclassified Olsenella]MDJ1121625.1 preprotein translocase subunit SecE [Olsenella sp. YH-ols2216]MDJ1129633.1 preprotein translocase subunit SecE [Olsenella sp. YH-ols2217]